MRRYRPRAASARPGIGPVRSRDLAAAGHRRRRCARVLVNPTNPAGIGRVGRHTSAPWSFGPISEAPPTFAGRLSIPVPKKTYKTGQEFIRRFAALDPYDRVRGDVIASECCAASRTAGSDSSGSGTGTSPSDLSGRYGRVPRCGPANLRYAADEAPCPGRNFCPLLTVTRH